MNLCNFVKTIIARATKDQTALDYWETHQNKPNELPNSPEKLVPKFNTNFSVSKRFISYSNIMKNYSKMQINQEKFRLLLPRIQKYVTQNTKWKNGNTNGQKQLFINTFSIYQWMKLSEKDKAKHTLTDCEQCMVFDASLLHKSSEVVKKDSLVGACQNVANIILEKSPPMSKAAEKNVENFVKVFTPIASQKLGVDIIKTVSKVMKLTPKKSKSQKTKTATKILKRNNIKIKNKLSSNGQDVRHFLASGKSFRKHDNDRMSMYFVTKAEAQQKLKVKIEKQKNALLKPKKHYGNFDHYTFEKEEFLSALRQFPHGSHVNWKKLGEQFNLTNKKGERPANAGQILMGFAQYNKINTDQFNINMRVSNRDYIQRVRRAKKRLSKGLTIPSTRSAKTIRQDIKHQIDNGVIDLGEKIAPSQISSNYIDNTGKLLEKKTTIYSRKFELTKLRQKILNEHAEGGLMRLYDDEHYDQLTANELKERYKRLGQLFTPNSNSNELKHLERIRMLKFWHDHSDVLNHTFVSFMLSIIYDKALYLTNEEYKAKFPERSNLDVQSVVERPHLYILGRSKSTNDEQLSFVAERVKDLMNLVQPTCIRGIQITDELRIFSGDGPARQFEAGQQQGGNFSCICGIQAEDHRNLHCAYNTTMKSLEERRQIFVKGLHWRNFPENSCPLSHLKKDDMADELEARGYNTNRKSKAELEQHLQNELKGIQRPPALMCHNPQNPADTINCSKYEVLACEPLHDITNIVQHIIMELPHHIQNSEVKKQLEKFSQSTIGEKNQIKGSDARLYAVKLAKFIQNLHQEKKIQNDVLNLSNALVEIINICYSGHDARNQRSVLRLHNQCFVFALACLKVIGSPQKMTARKFYGSHFHSLVIHAPETYRLLCLRSVVPEEEERTFGDIRSISKNTSNRQPEYVVDNAVMRFNAQQESHSVIESIQKQESVISQQAKFLDKKTNTTIKITDIIKNPYQFQCHLQRIPDFLLCGKGVWWSLSASSVIFHDTVDQDLNSNNPPLHNLRSTTLVEEQSYLLECWDEVLKRVEKSTIKIPVHKIKCYRNDQLVKTLYTDIFEDESSDEENTEIIHPIASAVIHNEEETINRTRSHETDESSEESESNDGMNTDTSSELENLEMLPIATPIIDDDCKDSEPIQPEDADLELPQICQSVNPTPTIDDKCGVPVVAKVNLYPNPENDETKKLYKSYMKVLKWSQKELHTCTYYPIEVNAIVNNCKSNTKSMELSAGNAQISHDNVKDCTKLPSDLQSNCQRPTQVLSNARQVSNYAAKKYTKLPITKPSECKGQARGAVKRKLNFGKERDDEEKENHQWKMVTSNTASSEIEKKSTRQKESSNNKTQKKMTNMTEMEKLELLFGETEEMRQLKADSDRIQRCPGVSSFQTALDCSHAKIQTKVVQKQSKLQGLLSKSPENKRLLFEKTLAELLLTSWNCYYEGSGKRI